MSVTIDGSGTITGISAGGLPDGSITNDDLAGSITDAKLSGTTCKAWVNFNGTGTVAIRASYNVSSITDNGTGDYTVNFTTALADANYAGVINVPKELSTGFDMAHVETKATGSFGVKTGFGGQTTSYTARDYLDVSVAIFR